MNRLAISLALYLIISLPASPQTSQPTQRDPQALATLAQALTTAGGASAVSGVQDFTGTGTITYYWAGQEVSGAVTVRGLGVSFFRLDAQLPQGTRSWLTTDTEGAIQQPSGATQTIQFANATNLGCLTLPALRMAAALTQTSYAVISAGTTTINGRMGTVIQVKQTYPSTTDPTGELSTLSTVSFVIDAQTYAVLAIQDTQWSDDGRMRPVAHQILFSNYTTVSGVNVPMSVVEQVGGQQTWSLQLTNIAFNTGLSSSLFQF